MADVGFEITNLPAVLADIAQIDRKIDAAAKFGVTMVALAVEREVKKTLNNNPHKLVNGRWQPSGHIGGFGSPPNRRSGNLQKSITTVTHFGFGTYVAEVRAGMVYARRLEKGLNYPYMRPASLRVEPRAHAIFKAAFQSRWSI